MRQIAAALLIASAAGLAGAQDVPMDRDALVDHMDATVHGWRYRHGEVPGAEAADFDDSSWERVDVGHKWWPHGSNCWFRTRLVMPETVSGVDVTGAAVRLKLGVDNGAKAYVDGTFKQEFTWADGDLLLTENAQPGQTFTIALNGINGPGYGRLYEAYLVSSRTEAMVDRVKELVSDFDLALSSVPYLTGSGIVPWEARISDAIAQLDMDAYRAGDEPRFAASVDKAREVLFADVSGLDKRLKRLAKRLDALKAGIAKGQADGLDLAYVRADARVVASFLQWVRDDLADGETAHTVRALNAAAFIEGLCENALDTLAAIEGDPSLDLKSPRYRTGPITIRDGAFWQNGRPVFFTGVGHFGQVRQDVPILPDYGLNIIQIENGPNSVVTGPDTVDDTTIREDVLATLDKAAKHNVAVNLLISPHYFPAWAIERNPELAKCDCGFLHNCIEAPDARDVYERHVRTLIPLVKDHPALHSICLSNEPQHVARCEFARKKFHTWLKTKHGSVAAANAIYETGFASFDAVPIPDASNYALFYDWNCFNQDRFLAFHAFLRDLIHEIAPDIPVHAKVMPHAFDDPGRFEVGINHEDFALLGTISGNDGWQMFAGAEPGPHAAQWLNMAMNYTLQRCVAPGNPVFNSENHIITDGESRYIPSCHIRTAYWTQALHGQGATTTWVWERAQGGDFTGNILTRANCVHALGRIALDLNRLAPEVHALQQTKGAFAILYAQPSMMAARENGEEVKAAYEGAYFTDAVCDFITERQLAAGKASDYPLIIVPRATHATNATVGALQQHIASGGVVMTVANSLSHDEYGRPRTEGLLQEGSGRLVAYPDPLTPYAYRDIIDGLLDSVGCERSVRVKGAHEEPLWGVHCRTVIYDGDLLVSLVNQARIAQTVTLETAQTITSAVNLFDNQEVGLPVTLKPLDPVLLRLKARQQELGNRD
jgi:Beta-galactosidase